ncbi:hypothetical protein NE865_14377 [Phthorimaea operculella]|nr:hypothetical protein NE865_14377 [Phthorimaea operculella]
MKQSLFLVLCTLAVALGANYNGLRVKYGPRAESADKNYYYNIPRSRVEAEQAGWTMFIQPYDNKVQGLYMYCLDNFLVCSLYNVQGFIAGLQISVPYEDFVPAPNTVESRMKVWQAPDAFGESAKIYWTRPIVFASEATFKSTGGPASGQTLQDGGVWVHGLDGNLLKFPSTEAELQKSNFTKENCVRGQGTHYHYKLNTETACENYVPYFGLVNNGELVGNGFFLFGKINKQPSGRQWFEDLRPYRETTLYATPVAPQCFYDWSDNYGVIGVHIYYIDEPWNISCADSDSVARSAPEVLEKIQKVQKELNINQN